MIYKKRTKPVAEVDSVETQAARYRFLIDSGSIYLGPIVGKGYSQPGMRYILALTCGGMGWVPADTLDVGAAIDHQMKLISKRK